MEYSDSVATLGDMAHFADPGVIYNNQPKSFNVFFYIL